MSAEPVTAIVWQPDDGGRRQAQLSRFMAYAGARCRRDLADPATLQHWSVACPGEFWSAVADFAALRFTRRAQAVFEDGGHMARARWFVGATLNFADNLLRDDDVHPALIWRDEAGRRGELGRAELRDAVACTAAAWRALGIRPGDVVAAVLPNGPEAVVAMLASAYLGAVWTACSPDFGAAGIVERFRPAAPRLFIAADGYHYGGRRIDSGRTAAAVAAQLPGLVARIWVPCLDPGRAPPPGWRAWSTAGDRAAAPAPAALPFTHPLCLLYSSGTTGPPKCIVHGAGGTLLQHVKEHLLHVDLRRGDRLFWFTTCGWMMWNWLVSGLASGATLVLYDGSPFHPDPGVLWRLAAEEGVTHFGTSPRYLQALAKAGQVPARAHDLGALRSVLSTGAPLSAEGFDFIHEAISPRAQPVSMSGGTDIVSCFVLGHPLLPVRRGEIQCAGLGMAVDVYDEVGRPQARGRGELVCTRPFPSLPLGFLGDADGRRFHDSYFARYPNVWAHGDDAERTASGGFVIHGRSDAVLNPGGVRIGTAELYRPVERVPEVLECLAVGQRCGGDERVVLFVVLRAGLALDDALAARIRTAIRTALTPRHVPAKLIQVPALPRTRSGKLAELAVRAVIHGQPVPHTAALANPDALDYFHDLAALADA